MTRVDSRFHFTARQLELFRNIMTARNMRVAAQSLNVAQSGLRRGLKAMEKRLGFKLVQFVRGKVQPTPEAVVLFGETQELARSFGRTPAWSGHRYWKSPEPILLPGT